MPSATTALMVIPMITPFDNCTPGLVVLVPVDGAEVVEVIVDGAVVVEVILAPPGGPLEVIVIFPLEEGATLMLLVASSGAKSGVPPGFKNPN